jgi:hypothetical protein
MVARSLQILMFILLPSFVYGQSVDLSVASPTANNTPSTFLLKNGELSFGQGGVQFLGTGNMVSSYSAMGISPDRSKVAFLKRSASSGEITLYSSRGNILNRFDLATQVPDDPSLAVFPFDNAGVLVRHNITRFNFYDTFGEISNSMSSSSQSEQGETISQVAMSATGQTVVIYNPKIKFGNNLGSKAQVMLADGSFTNIFFSKNRFLKDVTISGDGNIIVAITAREGADDEVLIMDKFGNELNTISTSENLSGASMSRHSDFLTLYSSGRVIVFSAISGEKVGATSLGSVFLAQYFPQDNTIIALTGNYSEESGVMSEVEVQAINVEQRAIESTSFADNLGFHQAIAPRLTRVGSNKYQLTGSSKELMITTSF